MHVFLSSTFKDLAEIRRRIEEAVHKAGRQIIQMEYFGARPEAPLAVSLQEVRDSDVLVLIVGARYGTIDAASGLSITHLEFREALRNNIPVLAFIVRPPACSTACYLLGLLQRFLSVLRRPRRRNASSVAALPHSPPESKDAQLDKFIDEIQSTPNITCAFVPSANRVPETVISALWRYVEEYGEPDRRFRVFAPVKAYFSPLLDQQAPFNLCHPMTGRCEELDRLRAFLRSEKKLCLVVAAGGTGKSKLIYELGQWRSLQEDSNLAQIRFYRLGIAITAEAFRELPTDNVCIVVDDAHRIDRLDDFIQACGNQPAISRLILTFRPGFVGAAAHALRGVPDSAIERIELQPLGRDTAALELAKACLGNEKSTLAKSLVALTDGNPLIITVGARLLNDRDVSPDLLDRKDEFISAALAGLLSTVPDPLTAGISRDKLLALLAAIQPFQASDDTTRKAIAAWLCVQPSDVACGIDTLSRHQVFFRRGTLARITPDVLGDYILHKAAVTNSSESTGFIDEAIQAFGEPYLANIIFNGAELDWRSRAEGLPVSVMHQVWRQLKDSLPQRSLRSRRRLLASLSRPAYYAPEQVFEIVEWCVDNPSAPPDSEPFAAIAGADQQSVLDAACELLAIIGACPDFAEPCTRILWNLARQDGRNPNPHPGHPLRILKDLAAYRTDNDLRTIEGVLRGLRRVIEESQHVGGECSICEIVDKSLEREVDFTQFDHLTVTLSARPLALDRVGDQRKTALSILKQLALGTDLPPAADAVHSLVNLLFIPHFKFGRETTARDLETFLPEAKDTVDMLVAIAEGSPYQVIQYMARRALLECKTEEWPRLKEYLDPTMAAMPEVPDEAILDALMLKPTAAKARLGWGEARQKAGEACQETAQTLWSRFNSPATLISYLTPIWEELRATGRRGEPDLFLFKLAEAAGDRLRELAGLLVAATSPVVRSAIPVVLRVLRSMGKLEDFEELVLRVANSEDVDTRRMMASNMSFCLYGGSEPGEQEIRLIAKMAEDPDPEVRGWSLRSLGRFGGGSTRAAIDVLLRASFEHHSDVAERALECLMPKYGIDPADLTDEDIDGILAKLRNIDAINDQHHHINEFLRYAATRRPTSVIRMLLHRIDKSALPGHSFSDGYTPIPFLPEHLNLRDVPKGNARLDLLREIREYSLKDSWQHSEYVPRLFRDLITDLKDAVAVVMEWGRSDDPAQVTASARLLRAMEGQLLFLSHAEFADMLENAYRLGTKCYEEVVSSLYILSSPKGARFVSPGEPDPLYVKQAERAAELAKQYASRPPVSRFFDNLEKSAQQWIKISQREDEEEL